MNARPLTPGDFPRFFKELWGVDPFPWQTRLLERVVATKWPGVLDLPTASGKTAVLDIAVFSLALEAGRPPAERRAPLRMVFVIDRRVVVDQAFWRADEMAMKLASARDGILADVAHNLRHIQTRFRDDGGIPSPWRDPIRSPISVAMLRGGMPRESDWTRTPTQPLILVSTVDQVGSRLLFRGYGVSDSMRPVHAGLLGEDVLYFLDEVHLSRPFEETLTAIQEHYLPSAGDSSGVLPHRFHFARMSATPGSHSQQVFTLDERDHAHEVLSKRLRASKRAVLRLVSTPKDESAARAKLAAACVREAELLLEDGVEVLAIIVNRVDTARAAAAVASEVAGRVGWTVKLMTGRMRPLDRQDLLAEIEAKVRAGRPRGSGERLLLVATQSIEAGADFDFDALVTECASLDALRQRFGRLDRLGERGRSHAVIVAGSAQTETDGDEPPVDAVYGQALALTWRWLQEVAASDDEGVVDFGIAAMEDRLRSVDERLFAPRALAPLLLPVHLDLYAQTSPRPAVEPPVSVFLHGGDRGGGDVQIVWRADIEPAWMELAAANAEAAGDGVVSVLREIVDMCPPSSLEAMSVPIGAARVWLARIATKTKRMPRGGPEEGARTPVPAVADVEGGLDYGQGELDVIAPVLVWRGSDEETVVISAPEDLAPGDTIIVPAKYGGIRNSNWDPDALHVTVADRGDEASLLHRAQAVIRWHPEVVRGWSTTGAAPSVAERELAERGADAEREAFAEWAAREIDAGAPRWAQVALREILGGRPRMIRCPQPFADRDGVSVRATVASRRVARRILRELRVRGIEPASQVETSEAATEGDSGHFVGDAQPLREHLRAVASWVRVFSEAAGLPESMAADLELAASLHDLGKADPRFQLMLHGGDAVRHAIARDLLAKSAIPANDRATFSRARWLARYPEGARHEVLSVALAESADDVRRSARDWDLVLHLVASHHGYCRPFAPVVADDDPVEVRVDLGANVFRASTRHGLARVDSGVASRYWALVRRYGWWRLAWLESLLRLADHRASEFGWESSNE